MASIVFGIAFRDAGALTAGLTPVWSTLRKLSDGSAVASPDTVAPVVALGGGLYKVTYDPEGADGELYGVLDGGATLGEAADRYVDVLLAQDSSRVLRLDATVNSRSTLTEANVRTAVGLASANLDTQLASLETNTNDLPTLIESDGLPGAHFTAAALALAPTSSKLVHGPYGIYLDGGSSELAASDVLYVGETPQMIFRVMDNLRIPAHVGASVTAMLTRTDTGAAVGDDIECEVRDAELGIVALDVPTEATDDSLAGKRLHLTLAWTTSGRTYIAGAFTLEVKAR